jgi:hypothetical protein
VSVPNCYNLKSCSRGGRAFPIRLGVCELGGNLGCVCLLLQPEPEYRHGTHLFNRC